MLQGKYPLLIALTLGLLAGLIAYSAIKARETAVKRGWETTHIICAAADVSEGTELGEEMVEMCEIPERFVTDSFIRVPEGDATGQSVMPYGQKVLIPLKKGDPVLYSHFESQRNFTLSEAIPVKARAIAIEVPEKSSVNQWIRPNDHVDVIGTFRDPTTRELVAVTLLQNIIVLATGHFSGMSVLQAEEDKKYQQVILLTLPEEAEILALAAETGQLVLTMRNPKDLEGADQATRKTKTDISTLMTGDKVDALRHQRNDTFQSIDVIKGTSSAKEIKGGSVGVPEEH